jgi:hypothetical protein
VKVNSGTLAREIDVAERSLMQEDPGTWGRFVLMTFGTCLAMMMCEFVRSLCMPDTCGQWWSRTCRGSHGCHPKSSEAAEPLWQDQKEVPPHGPASSGALGILAGTRVDEQKVDEQKVDEQIKIYTPTGKDITIFVTETRNTKSWVKNEDWSKYLIWKHRRSTGNPIKVPLDTTTGTTMIQLMNDIDKAMLGARTLILIVKADDTIQDVMNQVQAMLGGSLDYLLTHCKKLLSETRTVADCQINSYDVFVLTECIFPDR